MTSHDGPYLEPTAKSCSYARRIQHPQRKMSLPITERLGVSVTMFVVGLSLSFPAAYLAMYCTTASVTKWKFISANIIHILGTLPASQVYLLSLRPTDHMLIRLVGFVGFVSGAMHVALIVRAVSLLTDPTFVDAVVDMRVNDHPALSWIGGIRNLWGMHFLNCGMLGAVLSIFFVGVPLLAIRWQDGRWKFMMSSAHALDQLWLSIRIHHFFLGVMEFGFAIALWQFSPSYRERSLIGTDLCYAMLLLTLAIFMTENGRERGRTFVFSRFSTSFSACAEAVQEDYEYEMLLPTTRIDLPSAEDTVIVANASGRIDLATAMPTDQVTVAVAGPVTCDMSVSEPERRDSRQLGGQGSGQRDGRRSSREAESRLTHVLKGLYVSAHSMLGESVQTIQTRMGPLLQTAQQRDELDKSVGELLRAQQGVLQSAVDFLHERQAFMQLEVGSYVPQQCDCHLKETLQRRLTSTDVVELSHLEPGTCLKLDTFVLELFLQESLANVRKYSRAGSPVHLAASFHLACDSELTVSSELSRGSDGLTSTRASASGMLRLEITNENAKSVPLLTEQQCCNAFERGVSYGGNKASTGTGLSTVRQAAEAIGGHTSLRMHTTGEGLHMTTMCFEMPADVVSLPPSGVVADDGAMTGRDDSSLTLVPSPAPLADSVTAMPTCSPSTSTPPTEPADSSSKLVCFGLDDMRTMQILHESMMRRYLNADMTRSRSMGKTLEEQAAFVDVAMGRRNKQLQILDESERLSQADVVILDYNISSPSGKEELLGTQVAHTLRCEGFTGLVVLLTASTELDVFARNPNIDMACSKFLDHQQIASRIVERLAALPVRPI